MAFDILSILHLLCYAKLLQSCPTLCDPIDGSPPGPSVPGILQARTLEWVAISFSNAGKWKVKVKSLSHVWLLATPWTAAYQAPPSMGFSRQEYWSGVPLPSPYHFKVMTKKKILMASFWYILFLNFFFLADFCLILSVGLQSNWEPSGCASLSSTKKPSDDLWEEFI